MVKDTVDPNLSDQQDVSSFDVAIVVLVARSNGLELPHPVTSR
jgi:hypothetical protein